MNNNMSKLIASLLAGCLSVVAAPPSSIGFVHSTGDFRVDGAFVRGNSSLFDGNVIETDGARSVIQLSGAQLTLAPESRAKVFANRTVLEKGTGILRDANQHTFEAASLRVLPAAKDSVVQVELMASSRVSVHAVSGTAMVGTSSGLVLAQVTAGTTLAFDTPGSGGSTALDVTGTVIQRDGKYFLTDETTNVLIELRGGDVEQYVGKEVEVTGSIIPSAKPAGGASEVAQVASARSIAKAAKVAAHGISGAAKAAVIGGVAVSGTASGMAAAGVFSGPPSTSAK